MDSKNVSAGTEKLISQGVDLIISFGIAGALDPRLKSGSIIISTQVLTPLYKRIPCNPSLGIKIFKLKKNKSGVYFRPVIGSNYPITNKTEKKKIFKDSGAAAVDMETHIAAKIAQKKGIPFLAVRSICDTTDQNLPDFIATNIENKKKLNILKILELIVKKPYELKKFPKLIMNYRKSMNGLREIFRNFTL